MKRSPFVQYTLRNVPSRLDQALREQAASENKSLNETALAALGRGAGLTEEEVRYHDLDDLAGTWVADPEFDRALAAMDRVDPELWK